MTGRSRSPRRPSLWSPGAQKTPPRRSEKDYQLVIPRAGTRPEGQDDPPPGEGDKEPTGHPGDFWQEGLQGNNEFERQNEDDNDPDEVEEEMAPHAEGYDQALQDLSNDLHDHF